MKQLLVVYNNPQGQNTDYDAHIRLMKAELGKDYKVGRTALVNLEFWVRKNKLRVKTAKGLDLKKADAVFFAKWQLFQSAMATAVYLKRNGISFKPRQVANFPPTTKLGEAALLADNTIMLPKTLITSVLNFKEKTDDYLKSFSLPVVLKHTDASFGDHNYLIRSASELRRKVSAYQDQEIFMLQEYIPNDSDYRCLIFNGKLKVLIKRTRQNSKTHLNNTNKGALGEVITPVPTQIRRVAERAAKLTGRSDFAGVDIILHKQTGQPYVLEVNKMPVVLHVPARPEKNSAVASFLRSI